MTVAANGAPEFTQTLHSCHRLVRIACIFGSESMAKMKGPCLWLTAVPARVH